MDLYELLQGHIAVFLLMLVRVSGIFLISPFFGSMNISIYFRVGTALAITILLFPVVDGLGTPYVPENVIMFGVTAERQDVGRGGRRGAVRRLADRFCGVRFVRRYHNGGQGHGHAGGLCRRQCCGSDFRSADTAYRKFSL